MGDARRTRDDRSLAHILASQLNALADDWAPEDRHPDRVSTIDPVDDPFDPVAMITTGSHVWVDDMDALIARSFDYEAVAHVPRRRSLRSSEALDSPKARLRHGQM